MALLFLVRAVPVEIEFRMPIEIELGLGPRLVTQTFITNLDCESADLQARL